MREGKREGEVERNRETVTERRFCVFLRIIVKFVACKDFFFKMTVWISVCEFTYRGTGAFINYMKIHRTTLFSLCTSLLVAGSLTKVISAGEGLLWFAVCGGCRPSPWDVMATRTGGSWSHLTHSQVAGRDRCRCSACRSPIVQSRT